MTPAPVLCQRCNTPTRPGTATAQTWRSGTPDFIGGRCDTLVTLSPGGPGRLITCLKCPTCGWSAYTGEKS